MVVTIDMTNESRNTKYDLEINSDNLLEVADLAKLATEADFPGSTFNYMKVKDEQAKV